MRVPTPDVVAAAQAAYAETGILPSVSLAQWALESAWGTRCTGKLNFFGVQDEEGQGTLCWSHEEVNGVLVPKQEWFRDYDSVDDAFLEHAQMLASPKGNFAFAIPLKDDYVAYMNAIGPKYATATGYAASVINLIRADQFTRFDPLST